MSDFDEDVELPNSPLDQYLKQFEQTSSNNADERSVNNLNKVNNELPKVDTKPTTSSKTVAKSKWNRFKEIFNDLRIFILTMKRKLVFDKAFVNELFKTDASVLYLQILTHEDEKLVFDTVASIASKQYLKSQKSENSLKSRFYFCLKILFLAMILVQCGFLVPLVTFIFFLDGFLYKKLFYVTVKKAYDNMNSIQNLLFYLKQIELLGSNITNRFKLGDNVNESQQNIEYRKLVFKYFRQNFYDLKQMNYKLYKHLSQKISLNDDFKLICQLDSSELGELLVNEHDSDDNLAKLSDNFHLNSIKCLTKLLYLEISEQFKLLLLNYLYSNTHVNGLLEVLLKNLYSVYNKFKCRNDELNEIINICKLKSSKREENVKRVKQKLIKTNSLSLHLRNALLNSYKIDEQCLEDLYKSNENLLNSIEYDLEFCILYLKQTKSEYGKKDNSSEAQNKQNNNESNEKGKSTQDQVKIEKASADDQVAEENDYIFEALSNEHENLEHNNDNDENYEFEIEQRKFDLVNRNLFKELKNVLVTKQNEWAQREKNATHRIDPNLSMSADFNDTNNPSNLLESSDMKNEEGKREFLLDNDILKYKSGIRKRGGSGKKYENKVIFDDDDDAGNSSNVMQQANAFPQEHKFNLFNELKQKKHEMFSNNDNNDESDEIIYE